MFRLLIGHPSYKSVLLLKAAGQVPKFSVGLADAKTLAADDNAPIKIVVPTLECSLFMKRKHLKVINGSFWKGLKFIDGHLDNLGMFTKQLDLKKIEEQNIIYRLKGDGLKRSISESALNRVIDRLLQQKCLEFSNEQSRNIHWNRGSFLAKVEIGPYKYFCRLPPMINPTGVACVLTFMYPSNEMLGYDRLTLFAGDNKTVYYDGANYELGPDRATVRISATEQLQNYLSFLEIRGDTICVE